jgi:hypothetical protein
MVSACAGAIPRENVLMPALQEVWPRVREGIEREVVHQPSAEASSTLAAADIAMAGKDVAAVAAVNWEILDHLAVADLERRTSTGEVGPDVVPILRGRLNRFATERAKLVRMAGP